MLRKTLLSLAIISLAAFCFVFVTRIYLADVYYSLSRKAIQEGLLESGLEYINKSVLYNKNEPSYFRERARCYIAISAGENPASVEVLKKLALADLKKSQSLNPANLATFRNNIPYYYFLAIKDITIPVRDPRVVGEESSNIDEEYKQIARDYFAFLKKSYPNDAGLYVDIFKYEKDLFLKEDYEKTLERIKTLRPDLLGWHPNL